MMKMIGLSQGIQVSRSSCTVYASGVVDENR